MARVLHQVKIEDRAGNAIQNGKVFAYQPATTNAPIGNVYPTEVGGANGGAGPYYSDADGYVNLWFDTIQSIDFVVSDNGQLAYIGGNSGYTTSFNQYTVRGYAMPRPEDLGTSGPTFETNAAGIAAVAAAAVAGISGKVPESDHVHAHGSGYLPNAHHNQSHTDTDHSDGANVKKATFTTKGDILGTTAASTPVRVGVGTDGQVLTADAASAAGIKWSTFTTSSLGVADYIIAIDPNAPLATAYNGRTWAVHSSGANVGAIINGVMKTMAKVGPAGSQNLGTPGGSIQLLNVGTNNAGIPILSTDWICKPIQQGTAGVITGTTTLTQAGANFVADDVGRIICVRFGFNGTSKDLITTIATRVSATQVTLTDAGVNGTYAWCEPINFGVKIYGQGGCTRDQGGLHPDDGSLILEANGAGWASKGVVDFRNAGSWTVSGTGSEMFELHNLAVSGKGLADYAIVGFGQGTGNRSVCDNITAQSGTVANFGIGNTADVGGSADLLLTKLVTAKPSGTAHGLQINVGDVYCVRDFNLCQPTDALVIQSGARCLIGGGHVGGSGSGTPVRIVAADQWELGPGFYVDIIAATTHGGIWIAPNANNAVANGIIHPDTRFNLNDVNANCVTLDGGGGSGFIGCNEIRIGGMTSGFPASTAPFVKFMNGWAMRQGVVLDHVMVRQMGALYGNDGTTTAAPDIVGRDVMVTPLQNGTPGLGEQVLKGTLSGTGQVSIACWLYATPDTFVPGLTGTALAGRLSAAFQATTVAVGSDGVNVSTFAGAGVLNVASTAGFADAGSVQVRLNSGQTVIVSYTGKTGTSFTGCTNIGVTTGALHTSQAVQAVTIISSSGAGDAGVPVSVTAMVRNT